MNKGYKNDMVGTASQGWLQWYMIGGCEGHRLGEKLNVVQRVLRKSHCFRILLPFCTVLRWRGATESCVPLDTPMVHVRLAWKEVSPKVRLLSGAKHVPRVWSKMSKTKWLQVDVEKIAPMGSGWGFVMAWRSGVRAPWYRNIWCCNFV